MKVKITKLYCVQVLDNEGCQIDCEYVFCNKDEAKKLGKEMKDRLKNREN